MILSLKGESRRSRRVTVHIDFKLFLPMLISISNQQHVIIDRNRDSQRDGHQSKNNSYKLLLLVFADANEYPCCYFVLIGDQ